MPAKSPLAASPLRALGDAAEGLSVLDAPGKKVGKLVRDALKPGVVKDALSGTWLGHAVHPILTDVVVGSWTSATLLDLLGGAESEAAAEKLIGVGIAAYGPTALTGATDWADGEPADDGVRRVGLVHAVSNSIALALYSSSLRARRRGDHGRGVALGLAGLGAVTAGGYLGGHLVSRQGQGVDQTWFDSGPSDWTDAGAADDVTDGKPTTVVADDTPVLVLKRGETLTAIHDRCSHRGCSLASGDVDGDVIECPCHGSLFSLTDGDVLRGPATAPQPAFDARVREGRLEVKRR